MQKPQAFGSASSYGKKYALGNLLLIDDTADADATNNHKSSNTTKAKPKQKEDSFKQSVEYLKSAPEDKKSSALQLILSKYGDKFSDKQKETLQRLT